MKKFVQFLPLIIITSVVVLMINKIVDDNKSGRDASDAFFENAVVGTKVPEINIKTTAKNTAKMFLGKISVINVFASWCAVCQYEHPLFSQISGNKDVQLIGVSWRDKQDDTVSWLKKHGNPYDIVAYDELGKYGISLGIRGVPETFVVNSEGVIIKHIGGNIDESFIKEVNGLLK